MVWLVFVCPDRAVEATRMPELARKTTTCKTDALVNVPLVSLDDLAIRNTATDDALLAPVEASCTHPLGIVGGVVLFLPPKITIKSPAWCDGIVIVVACAEAELNRLIAIYHQVRIAVVPSINRCLKYIVPINILLRPLSPLSCRPVD